MNSAVLLRADMEQISHYRANRVFAGHMNSGPAATHVVVGRPTSGKRLDAKRSD